MDQNLSAACQMFLVPVSILFGSLGVAEKEQLKTLISIMGLVTSGVWVYRIWEWKTLPNIDWYTTIALAGVFALAWLIALLVHGKLWLWPSRQS